MSWYGFVRGCFRIFVYLACRIEVHGKANLPSRGPFILVANHQSILDPIVVQVVCPRHLYTLTKSTKFAGRFFGWIMPRLKALPTRRYRIDPQVVRVALKTLARGDPVGIYPEGERSWDSGLQPLRLGTIRLLLKAGVPVVPCGVVGTYDVWPRWSRGIRRRKVRVSFGTPLRWQAMNRRTEREAALPGALEALTASLVDLSAWGCLGAPAQPGGPADGPQEPEGSEGQSNALQPEEQEPAWLTDLLA
jgi:1-acyl-sn-glycerol-3-phosphate acyltransferase